MNAPNAQPRRKVSRKQANSLRRGLLKAVEHFGSQGKMARAVGIAQPSIYGAILRGQASKKLAERIHDASNGAVPKWTVRPDLFKRGGAER